MPHTSHDIAGARPEELLRLAGVPESTQEVIFEKLARMREEIPFVHAHSLRVGAHAFVQGQGEHPAYWRRLVSSSYLHDVGKLEVRHELFRNSWDITPAEYEEIKRHAFKGWYMLKDVLPFEAAIAGMHHRKENNGYGVNFEECLAGIPQSLWGVVRRINRQVSLTDYFDAFVTRNNVKGELCAAIAKEYTLALGDACSVVGRLRETYPFAQAR